MSKYQNIHAPQIKKFVCFLTKLWSSRKTRAQLKPGVHTSSNFIKHIILTDFNISLGVLGVKLDIQNKKWVYKTYCVSDKYSIFLSNYMTDQYDLNIYTCDKMIHVLGRILINMHFADNVLV